jgi:MFS family permease
MLLRLTEDGEILDTKGASPRRARISHHWVMLCWVSFAQMVSWGILYYGFSVFMTPIGKELSWSKAQMTGAFSLSLGISGLAAIPVGAWLDRKGPKLLMSIGSLSGVVLLVALSQVRTLTEFYLVWAGIGFTMAAVLYEPAFFIVATWFRKSQSKALIILTLFGGLASVIFVPLSSVLIESVGWRAALQWLSIVFLFATFLPHIALPETNPPLEDGRDEEPCNRSQACLKRVLKERDFWLIAGTFALVTLSTVALSVHFISLLLERGYSATFAAGAMAALGLMSLPGRFFFAPLLDRCSNAGLTAGIFAALTLSFIALAVLPGLLGIVLFIVIFGSSSGAVTIARVALLSQRYGPAQYGRLSGILSALLTSARAGAPYAASLLYGLSRSYLPVLWSLAALAGISTVFLALVARRQGFVASTKSFRQCL